MMKTGLLESDALPPQIEDMLTRIKSIMLVLMKRALIRAANFATHNGSTIVESEDIEKGVRLEAITFFDSDGVEEEMVEMMGVIDEAEGDEGYDSDDTSAGSDGEVASIDGDEDDEAMDIKLVPDEAISKQLNVFLDHVEDEVNSRGVVIGNDTCECSDCQRYRDVDAVWDAWQPGDDPVKQFLKHHVERSRELLLHDHV
jgi:hypothetical protein